MTLTGTEMRVEDSLHRVITDAAIAATGSIIIKYIYIEGEKGILSSADIHRYI